VGINTAISSPTGSSVGIGFAVPIDRAKLVMADLLDDGQIQRGYLGLNPQDIELHLAKGLGLSTREGTLVGDALVDGPAYAAGIRTGDVVTHIDSVPVRGANQLRSLVVGHKPGETIEVKVLRDGREKTFRVELADRAESLGNGAAAPVRESEEERLGELGLQLQNLTPQLRQQLGEDEALPGVVVVGVARGSVAALAGFQRGDVIQRVGATPTPDLEALAGVLSDLESGDSVAFLVRRAGSSLYIGLKKP
jgi:serine protease Do